MSIESDERMIDRTAAASGVGREVVKKIVHALLFSTNTLSHEWSMVTDRGLREQVAGLQDARGALVVQRRDAEQRMAEAESRLGATSKALAGVDAAIDLLRAEAARRAAAEEKKS